MQHEVYLKHTLEVKPPKRWDAVANIQISSSPSPYNGLLCSLIYSPAFQLRVCIVVVSQRSQAYSLDAKEVLYSAIPGYHNTRGGVPKSSILLVAQGGVALLPYQQGRQLR